MGKKINPKIFRIGVTDSWSSIWYGRGNDYIERSKQDVLIRKYLIKNFREAGIDKVKIERDAKKIKIIIFTAKPGVIIGRGGAGIEGLKNKIHRKFLKKFRPEEVDISIKEVSKPNLSAQIAVQSMIMDLEKRMPFKRVMKQTIGRIERAGALGARVIVSGRLNGAEIARSEKLVNGKIPLHTLRANIDYARGHANTTYGSLGVKVWIYKGELFEEKEDGEGEVVKKAGSN